MASDTPCPSGHWRDGSDGVDLNDRFLVDTPEGEVPVVEASPLDDPCFCNPLWISEALGEVQVNDSPACWRARYQHHLAELKRRRSV